MAVHRSGWAGTSEVSVAATRLPAGHPEGYLEAFAQLAQRLLSYAIGR